MNIPALNEFEKSFRDEIWLEVAADICRTEQLTFERLTRAEHGENIVILVDEEFVIKIYTPKKKGFNRERAALEFAQGKTSLPIPQLVAQGEIEGFYYLVTDRLPGQQLLRPEWLTLERSAQVSLLTQLAHGLRELHSNDAADVHFDWHKFVKIQVNSVIERQRAEGGNPEWTKSLPAYLDNYLLLLPKHPPTVFLHGDVHFGNIRVTADGGSPVISGLFDFADSLKGFHEYEFVAIGVLMIQGQGDLQREFFRAYGYRDADIDISLRRRLMLLTILYEHSSLRRYAERLGPGSERLSLEELEKAIWSFT